MRRLLCQSKETKQTGFRFYEDNWARLKPAEIPMLDYAEQFTFFGADYLQKDLIETKCWLVAGLLRAIRNSHVLALITTYEA